jgi:hypothetical protein
MTLESKNGANRVQTGHFEDLVRSQEESLSMRKEKFCEIRQKVDQTINKKFKDMLRTGRNWKGKIEVDHSERQVILSVTPHKGVLPASQLLQRQLLMYVMSSRLLLDTIAFMH